MRSRLRLGVNVDHVATLRQARGEDFPDVVRAAKQAIAGGADSIVAHLREDRRHIQDKDIWNLRKLNTHFDMEMAATPEMLKIALKVRPDMCTLVPEKRKELTTEGGLDVANNLEKLKPFVGKLEKVGINVSLFIDPKPAQIKASAETGASFIEIHTGKYARSTSAKELKLIKQAVILARKLGIKVNAGHGLDYGNAKAVAGISGIEEFNIGFSIIARAVFVGIKTATSQMKKLLIVIAALTLLCSATNAATTESVISSEVNSRIPVKEAPLFRDVPVDHWALSSVNKLVKMGVTQGYPDGTFRGESRISRYETAVFLSKLAQERDTRNAVDEKLLEELKAELYKIQYTLDMYKKPKEERPVYGSFVSRLRLGNIVNNNAASTADAGPIGPVFDYRLIANYIHEFGEDSYLRFGIDTMDSSLSGGRDLAREMFEAEATVNNRSGFGVTVTGGPGLIVHHEGASNIFPEEDNTVYLRPNNGIKLTYGPGNMDSGIGFMSTSVSTWGQTNTNDMYGYVAYTFKNTFLGTLTTKYSMDRFSFNIAANMTSKEATINMYEFTLSPVDKLDMTLKLGAAGSNDTPHNSYIGLILDSKEFFKEGSSAKLYAHKIGSDFFLLPTYPGILGVNTFNKLFQGGTYDVGAELDESMSKDMTLRILSDIVTGPNGEYGESEPLSNSTYEMDIDLGVFESATLTLGYQVFQEPSAVKDATSDTLGISFRYEY